jgi:hypothetical protein
MLGPPRAKNYIRLRSRQEVALNNNNLVKAQDSNRELVLVHEMRTFRTCHMKR